MHSGEGSPPKPAAETAEAAGAAADVRIPEELGKELRKLSHDLSNALEVIVQTSYLLSLAELKEPASEWLRMLEGGVGKALELNQAMRTYLRDHSGK